MRRFLNRRRMVGGLVAALAVTGLRPAVQAAAGAAHTVRISSFAFEPTRLEVSVGDTITWVNDDVVPHTATASDKSWGSGSLDHGQSQTLTVNREMQGSYYCRHHPSMVAELVIV